jgi:hypothetical protein
MSRISDYEPESRFLRLKREKDSVLTEVAITSGFVRENPERPRYTGVSEDLVGTTTAPPKLGLPWSSAITEHVPLHDMIIGGTCARNGATQGTSSSKAQPWHIGEYFKEGDLGKTTIFLEAYSPHPSIPTASADAPPMESTPRAQPFEYGMARGSNQGTMIDISKGYVRLPEVYLKALETLVMRSVGAYNSLDTLIHFAANEQERLSPERLA